MKTVIIHHNDPDGRLSAAIAARYDCVPNPCVFAEMSYKDPVPWGRIYKGDRVIIVDFSLKPDDFARLEELTSDIVWIDHHKTAESYPYANGPRGIRDFTDKGPAACELAWQWFALEFQLPQHRIIPKVVRLVGDYDSWRLEHQPDSLRFREGLNLFDQNPAGALWAELIDNPKRVDAIIEAGKTAIQYRDNYCAELRKAFGYSTSIGGHKAYALNAFRFGSKAYAEVFDSVPICIAYIHDGDKWTVSLYSKIVDVGEIARAHGGGGHKGAAGFVCESLPFRREE